MLPKKNRFSRTVFDSFLHTPQIQTVYNKLGTLKYLPTGHIFAVVTASKHEKRAVVRNKLRRRLYERFKIVRTPLSGIFYASKLSYSLDLNEIRALFDELITKTTHRS